MIFAFSINAHVGGYCVVVHSIDTFRFEGTAKLCIMCARAHTTDICAIGTRSAVMIRGIRSAYAWHTRHTNDQYKQAVRSFICTFALCLTQQSAIIRLPNGSNALCSAVAQPFGTLNDLRRARINQSLLDAYFARCCCCSCNRQSLPRNAIQYARLSIYDMP